MLSEEKIFILRNLKVGSEINEPPATIVGQIGAADHSADSVKQCSKAGFGQLECADSLKYCLKAGSTNHIFVYFHYY